MHDRSMAGMLAFAATYSLASLPSTAAEHLRSETAPSCIEYYEGQRASSAEAWCSAGSTFDYQGLEIFYVCLGNTADPFIYLNHGWPTSSFDFAEIMHDLSRDHRVCALDTPGYGFSDKPKTGYVYSIFEDAELVEHFLTRVARVSELVLLTHDKGDSVGLELLARYLERNPGYQIRHHFILNGNIYLPEAEISTFQELLLDDHTGPPLAQALDGRQLALLLGLGTYTPPLSPQEQTSLATTFDYRDGTDVLDQTIEYLDERAEFETTRWLAALAASNVPTTLIWGELDQVAPTGVADYVWCETLAERAIPARYWRVPAGNHYVQNDRPQEVVGIVRQELGGPAVTPAPRNPAFIYAGPGDTSICEDRSDD